ncbi:MAG: RagB/SusD family nutrient uptake outer membrane protein [Mucilaginibacter sp.]
MKRIFILLSIIALGSFSCKKQLNEVVISNVTDSYYNTPVGFDAAVNAAYSYLRSFYATERGMTLSVFGTDTYTNGSDGGYKFVNQYTSQLGGRTDIVEQVWNDSYSAINVCNTVIDRADHIPGLDNQTKLTRVGEARFLRAQYNFLLVQMFGPIPLNLHENKAAITVANRIPIDSVYSSIISDLQFAEANLPVIVPASNNGRAHKAAAEHLLARVYLTRASSTAAKPDDYQHASDYAKMVINNYTYKLLPDFARVFDEGSGEVNSEVIWSVQYTSDPLTNSTGNNAHVFFLMEYDTQPGMQRDVQNGRPYKRFKPTDYTLNVIFKDRLNDTRYEKSFKSTFLCNKPGSYKASFDGTKTLNFAAGDTTIFLPGYNPGDNTILTLGTKYSKAYFDSRPYQVLTPSKYTQKLYPTLIKFLDPLRPDKTTFEGSRDFLAFRLAETYLIAGEALMMQGKTTEAAQYINTVRLRSARTSTNPVDAASYQAAMLITPGQLNIDFILDERARELLGEQLRWFDLVRTHKLIERVQKYNPDGAANIKDYHVLRPIPQTQIDRSTNAFAQNPGY